ncbi:MAG TPA: glycosyltransferase [Acidimicrobiales bacterium]|nr:glycosyltransferase [Acidimicrobiales bacterium]
MSHDEPQVPWPKTETSNALPRRVGAVIVNWNTRALLARTLFGLTRVLETGPLHEIVVVDNASDDGSVELAHALADAGVIRLITNSEQRYHGPGLTQGVNLLSTCEERDLVDLIWALDSDVFVLRPDVLRVATATMTEMGAVYAGDPEGYEPGPPQLTTRQVLMHSTLFDPRVVWRPRYRPFLEHGDPSGHMQSDLRAEEHRILAFPFCSDGYLLHLGRSTLAEVAARAEASNRYYDWASTHFVPHYGLHPRGAELLAEFEERYRVSVPDDGTDTIVEALVVTDPASC